MSKSIPITVTNGDGIGPEIMQATLSILKAAGSNFDYELIEIGQESYLNGHTSGISDEAWKTIKKNRLFLKAPITTPQGEGYKSLNVSIRKSLGLYANIRPCLSYHPFVKTFFPNLDVVIIRENEEDLYMGIEHELSPDIMETKKIVTRNGCEKIVKYAFEYAVKNNRKKVTCMTKDNIMKLTDGMFHKVFNEIAKDYSGIESEHYIIDIGTARLANRPNNFDVVVTMNLYGDIISDVVAEISGSVGLAGSANIGTKYAMFEAIHGSAPSMAGMNKANPSGLLNGAIMMLAYSGQGDVATKVRDALLYTIESGVVTYDVFKGGESKKSISTSEFAEEIVKNLGKAPEEFKSIKYPNFEFDNDFKEVGTVQKKTTAPSVSSNKTNVELMVVFDCKVSELMESLNKSKFFDSLSSSGISLESVSTKGIVVYEDKNVIHDLFSDFWLINLSSKGGESIFSLASDLKNALPEPLKCVNIQLVLK